MELDKVIKNLQELQDEGHGSLPVFAVHGGSGSANKVSYGFLREYQGHGYTAIMDLKKGDPYIVIYIG